MAGIYGVTPPCRKWSEASVKTLQMVQQRIPLANFLDQIDTKTAKILLLAIARGVISNINAGTADIRI